MTWWWYGTTMAHGEVVDDDAKARPPIRNNICPEYRFTSVAYMLFTVLGSVVVFYLLGLLFYSFYIEYIKRHTLIT